jgi:phage terminase large subunit-like protein
MARAKKPRGRGRSPASATPSDGGYWFDEEVANSAVRFVEDNLPHWQGEWAGLLFKLEPWQRQIVRDLFGWKRPDGTRKFRYAYVEVPKGNGKSVLGAAIALLLLFWDEEPGAEVYSIAGDRQQARIVFTDAANMVEQSDQLAAASITLKDRIVYPRQRSFYQVLSADAPTKHGFRPHGIVFDELHVQPNRHLFDILRLGMKKRRQALMFEITTAGVFDEDALCWAEHCYAKGVLSGEIVDPTFYAVIYGAEEGDDWTSPTVWAAANPNLGVTVRVEDLQEDVNRVLRSPAEQPGWKQMHLNIWGQTAQGGIDLNAWRRCIAKPKTEEGAPCFIGMDLSSKLDLTAVVAVFPHDDGAYSVLPFFWIPEENIEERKRRDIFDYPRYVAEGLITATPGNRVDYESVRAKVVELGQRYRVQEIGFDAWNAQWISSKLQDEDGFNVVEVPQQPRHLGEPSKELVGLVADGKLYHGGNPVLTWNAGNVVFRRDVNDNWAPAKDKKGRKRIDGIVALIMALGRARLHEEAGPAIWRTTA